MSEEDGLEELATTTEAAGDGKKYTTRPRNWRQRQRQRLLCAGPEGSTTMTVASAKETSDDDRGVCRGQGLDSA